jgi:energy-coupling factor transporter ATP-binding protein EcfA2
VNPGFLVETKGLRFAYREAAKHWVLDGIDLQIRPDEYVLISGASGSGKSTLCRTFNGLIPHFSGGVLKGEVRVSGITTATQSTGGLFKQVGMVFQNPEAQLFNRTVEREIAFGLESLGVPRPEIVNRILHTAEEMSISALLTRNPAELSLGEQQMVAIASILALEPKLIVLDEPYASLDPLSVRKVRNILKKIHSQGTGIVICEHRLPYTVPDIERMVVLHDRQIVLDGTPGDVLGDNVEHFGLELPLPVQVGKRLEKVPLPLDLPALRAMVSFNTISSDLNPVQPDSLSENAEIILEAENVSFVQNSVKILHSVNLILHRGECLAIAGPNGAGKTTLLKHLIGLCRPSTGRVRVVGQDAGSLKVSELARHVGIAFQNPDNQFFKQTVLDEIIAGPRALDCYDESWIQELVKLFQLESLLERAPYRLSGGEKKRVAFASALASKPKILALDEPTSGQDWFFRRALGNLLIKLRSQGLAVILVTHDLAFAEQYAHRWLIMANGRIVADDTPWKVMADRVAMERANLEPTDAFQLFGGRHARS